MDVLYRDFGAKRYLPIDQRIGNGSLNPAAQVFGSLSDLAVADAVRYQRTPENSPTGWFVSMDIDTVRDHKAWATVVVPAGEKFVLYKHLPGWNKLSEVAYFVGCGSQGMADISVVAVADPTTDIAVVETGLDLSVESDDCVATPHYIQRSNSYLLKVVLTPPFTNANGEGVFVKGPNTPCEERTCLRLMVNAHLKTMGFRENIRGCRLDEWCSPVTTLTDPCADSDGDGILDSDEGLTTDTDGDGIPDYLESNTADSDGDGITDVNDPT